jgi:hypothetical protein
LSEIGVLGYAAGAWSCSGGSQSGSDITVGLGDDVICTIVNNDIAPKLTLVKEVINDNGGTQQPSAFTLTAVGPTGLTGSGPTVTSGGGFAQGAYTLSETGPDGYAASPWTCTGDGVLDGDVITLGLGSDATCTITNNDVAPRLTVIKTVVNDHGGTKQVADFVLTVDGNTVTSGTQYALNAGNHTVSETQLYGYTASAWGGDCAANGTITLGLGDVKTCTITNDDQPATIVIKKVTKPANTGSFAFTTTGTGLAGFTIGGGQQNSQQVAAGTYTVTESSQLGWILTGIGGSADPLTPFNCVVTGSGGSTGVGNLATLTASISVRNGDTVTCTFENTGQGVTRTQGFWSTHPQLADIAWFGGTAFGHTFPGVGGTTGIGDRLICGRPIDSLAQLTGGFWSDIAKTSTGAKRTALDQARMQLLQQLLAAELNASAFGSVPSGGIARFAQWETALCGTNTTAIKNAQAQAAAFNSQGDAAAFTPGTSAQSRFARSIADRPFWNIIKP